MSALAVIPARFESTRLPGKPLVDIQGHPLVYHVYRRVSQAKNIERVIVATDHDKVREAVESFGGFAVMTSNHHKTGTERIAEIAQLIPYDIIINVQVDEPMIRPELLDSLVALLNEDTSIQMATLATPLQDLDELDDPNVVKLVTAVSGEALYFSRSAIPFPFLDNYHHGRHAREIVSYRNELIRFYLKHIGVYAYRKNFLMQFVAWEPTPLEKLERLEQLRALEHGARIHVMITQHSHYGLDTPEDLERFRRIVEKQPDILELT